MAPRALTRSLSTVTRPVLEKRGQAFAALVAGWPEIVGRRLAEDTAVEKLTTPRDRSPGTLHLRVTPALALEIQHMTPQLLERINGALGYAAVGRLALLQAPIHRPPPRVRRAPRPRHDPSAETRAAAQAAAVEDPELRAALQRFGAHLLRKSAG